MVVKKMTSKTYTAGSFFSSNDIQGPESALTKSLDIGNCWAMAGSEGMMTLELSSVTPVTHVTITHVHKQIAPQGDLASAPRSFDVIGYTVDDVHLERPKLLGRGAYSIANRESTCQVFPMTSYTDVDMKHVSLQIKNNFGQPEYTCIYRFMVHNGVQYQ